MARVRPALAPPMPRQIPDVSQNLRAEIRTKNCLTHSNLPFVAWNAPWAMIRSRSINYRLFMLQTWSLYVPPLESSLHQICICDWVQLTNDLTALQDPPTLVRGSLGDCEIWVVRGRKEISQGSPPELGRESERLYLSPDPPFTNRANIHQCLRRYLAVGLMINVTTGGTATHPACYIWTIVYIKSAFTKHHSSDPPRSAK